MPYDNDVEDRGTSGSRTPLLGSSSHQRIGRDSEGSSSTLMRVLQFFGGGIYAPDPTTYDPVEILLNTEDEDEQDELTVKWRDNKVQTPTYKLRLRYTLTTYVVIFSLVNSTLSVLW
jgi:hypothetical protein